MDTTKLTINQSWKLYQSLRNQFNNNRNMTKAEETTFEKLDLFFWRAGKKLGTKKHFKTF